jgi:superoxide reductase
MNSKNDIFQCDICGNLVSVLNPGKGRLKCCGEEMIRLKPKTAEPASDNHIPFIKENESCYEISIGKHLHPMVKAHYIGFLQIRRDNYEIYHFFGPGENPVFEFSKETGKIKLGSYCLIHGFYEIDYSI